MTNRTTMDVKDGALPHPSKGVPCLATHKASSQNGDKASRNGYQAAHNRSSKCTNQGSQSTAQATRQCASTPASMHNCTPTICSHSLTQAQPTPLSQPLMSCMRQMQLQLGDRLRPLGDPLCRSMASTEGQQLYPG